MIIHWPEVIAFCLLIAFLTAMVLEVRSWARAALRFLAAAIAHEMLRQSERP